MVLILVTYYYNRVSCWDILGRVKLVTPHVSLTVCEDNIGDVTENDV